MQRGGWLLMGILLGAVTADAGLRWVWWAATGRPANRPQPSACLPDDLVFPESSPAPATGVESPCPEAGSPHSDLSAGSRSGALSPTPSREFPTAITGRSADPGGITGVGASRPAAGPAAGQPVAPSRVVRGPSVVESREQ